MSPKEFVHFLNGTITLGKIDSLDNQAFTFVNESVKAIPNENTPEGIFCTWLKGFLEASENQELSASQFTKVAAKLSDVIQNKTVFDTTINTKVPTSILPQPGVQNPKMRC